MINTEHFIHHRQFLFLFQFPCVLSSSVIQLTPYFMNLLVLILIVNRNFKLLNWRSIYYYNRLCCFHLLSVFFMLLLFALLLSFNYYYYYYYYYHYYDHHHYYHHLRITFIIYSLIYLFIYSYLLSYLFIHLFIYHIYSYKVQNLLTSPLPTSDLLQFILHTFKICETKYVNLIKEYILFIAYCSSFPLSQKERISFDVKCNISCGIKKELKIRKDATHKYLMIKLTP